MIDGWLFHRPPKAGVVHSLFEQALSWPQFVLNSFSQGMRDIDHRERLSRFAFPALVVHGRHDRKQLYDGAVYAAQLVRHARLVTLEQSAHMGQIEELNGFNQALSKFVRDVATMARAA
jgi:non-heme chloroperoxidase